MTNSLVNAGPRTLGRFTVGPLGFGCWRFTSASLTDAQAVLEVALENDMNFVDTADVYGLDWGGTGFGDNEVILGKVLAAAPELRDRMVLATKGGIIPPTPYNSGAEYITKACEDSLRRLGVERIDLYQIHRPDFYTHPEELAGALSALQAAGKIAEVGVSNSTAGCRWHGAPSPAANWQPGRESRRTSSLRWTPSPSAKGSRKRSSPSPLC